MNEFDTKPLKELFEEGVFDWLFSRWRTGGRWKGGGKKYGKTKEFGTSLSVLDDLYNLLDKWKDDYPTTVRRIKTNIKRIGNDIMSLQQMIVSGESEAEIFNER